jgi:hydroxymethylpyrimidine/phosphomethylpyrimidine kinase
MWAIILVFASGAHHVINLPITDVESTTGRSCMIQGALAAKTINASDLLDKVKEYQCVRQS